MSIKTYTPTSVDWIHLYLLLIEVGVTEFTIVKLRRLPIRFINELSQRCVKQLQQRRNFNSLTEAKMGQLIYQLGMKFLDSKNPAEVNIKDFLPHPELVEEDKNKLSVHAREIIRRLVKTDSIGKKITSLLAPLI